MAQDIFDSDEQSPAVPTKKATVEESPAAMQAREPAPAESPVQQAASEDVGMIQVGTEGGIEGFDGGHERARKSGDPAGTRTALATSIAADQHFQVSQQLRQFVQESAQSEQDILDAMEASSQMTANIEARMASPVLGERTAMEAVAEGAAPPDELDMAAVDRKISNDLRGIDEDTDWMDYTWSFLRPVVTLGIAPLEDAISFGGVENILDVQEKLQVQALQFQTIQDPAEKLASWEALKVAAFEELPDADALAYLSQMATASGTVGFEEYNDAAIMWGVVDSGSVATAAARGLASGVRNLPKAAKNLGNNRLAGKANAKALEAETEEAAQKMGMSGKLEAADNAHPVPAPDRTGPNGSNPEASMSLETQREIQAHRADMNTMVDNYIVGKTINKETGVEAPTEGSGVLARIQARAARYVESLSGDVQQAAMKLNDDGSITVTAAIIPKGGAAVPTSKELIREGNRLAKLAADGFITQKEATQVAELARKKGSSLDSIRNVITDIEEGVGVREAVGGLNERAPQNITRTFRATLDDTTGAYEQDRLPIGSWARSNRAAAMTPDVISDFEAAARLDNTSAKIAHELNSEVTKIFKSLPLTGGEGVPVGRRKAKLRIQQALIEGDEWIDPKTGEEVGKVFTPDELTNKFGLSDKEKEAYYKLRSVYDSLYRLRDSSVREELVSRGYTDIRLRKKIDYIDEETGKAEQFELHEIGRPIEDGPRVARSLLEGHNTNMVLNGSTGKVEAVPQDLASAYNKGARIVQFHEPVSIPGQGRVRFALVDGTHEIRDLPMHGVVQYKAGYVPRVYDRGVWFVKETAPYARVDGRRMDEPLTVGTRGMADNEAAAKALVARLTREAEDAGDTGTRYEIRADNQVDPLELALSGASGSGGRLYTSTRGSKPVPFYRLEGDQLIDEKASRIDAFEALQSNINNIAFHYPRNEWRIASVLKLQKTADKMGVKWNGIHEAPTGGTTQGRAFIERKRQELQQWLALPDAWETRWNDTMQTLYEKALGIKVNNKSVDDMLHKIPSRGLWWLKSNDPVTALRSATFHLLLGWFNPAQWFVQAQGFAPALAQSARFGGMKGVIGVWKTQNTLRALENAVNSGVAENMTKVMIKHGLTDETEARKALALLEIWKRSGLKEGVLTTGDFKNASNAMGHGVGALADFANNKGLWFYRQGETFSRRFSLTAAFEDFLVKNPDALKKGITDAQEKAILAKANDFMLNLGKANKASWQRGVLSIPTQFWQVQAKLLEQYLTFGAGRVLTGKEKMALALGQVGLYGAAGVPILGAYTSYFADRSSDPNGVANRTLDEGFYGLVLSAMDVDVEVAKRGAILADIQGLLYDFLGGDKTLTEMMLGAGNTTLGRIGEAISRIQPLALSAFDQEMPTTQEDFVMALDALGGMTTTWSNASKAYVMGNTGILYSRSGKKLAIDEYNFQTLMMTALGFTPRDESQTYALGTQARMLSSYKSDVKKSVTQHMLNLVKAHNLTGRPIGEEDARKFRAVVGLLTANMNPAESKIMIEEIQKEVLAGKSELAKAVQAYMRVSGEIMVDDMLGWFDKTVIGQQAIDEEEIR